MASSAASEVFSLLDHSLLTPGATSADFEDAAEVALRLEVAALCIVPYFVPRAAELLARSRVRVCTVIAFPHGTATTRAKLAEAEIALDDGAQELDVVTNVSRVRSGEFAETEDEMRALAELVHFRGGRLKWIFETAALEIDQKIRLAEIATRAGVDWVKTSTGFGPGGATPEDVALLRQHTPSSIGVKASGGIRTLAEVRLYAELGASRIGTSRSLEVAEELRRAEQSQENPER